jgi:hypothetical protein
MQGNYQYDTVAACSSRKYHILDSKTNDGWQHASNIPSSVLTVTRDLKSLHAAWHISVIPQSMMLIERYFAMGTRWITQFVGYSTIKIAI